MSECREMTREEVLAMANEERRRADAAEAELKALRETRVGNVADLLHAAIRDRVAAEAERDRLRAALEAVVSRHHLVLDGSRDWSDCPECGRACAALSAAADMDEVADDITALTAERDRLREAAETFLREQRVDGNRCWCEDIHPWDGMHRPSCLWEAAEGLRVALEGQP